MFGTLLIFNINNNMIACGVIQLYLMFRFFFFQVKRGLELGFILRGFINNTLGVYLINWIYTVLILL